MMRGATGGGGGSGASFWEAKATPPAMSTTAKAGSAKEEAGL